jgi:hypothetical protein
MTPQAKDMADIARVAMQSAYPMASVRDQVSASFIMTSHYCDLIIEESTPEALEHNRTQLEGLIMGLFAQLNPPPTTH